MFVYLKNTKRYKNGFVRLYKTLLGFVGPWLYESPCKLLIRTLKGAQRQCSERLETRSKLGGG